MRSNSYREKGCIRAATIKGHIVEEFREKEAV